MITMKIQKEYNFQVGVTELILTEETGIRGVLQEYDIINGYIRTEEKCTHKKDIMKI